MRTPVHWPARWPVPWPRVIASLAAVAVVSVPIGVVAYRHSSGADTAQLAALTVGQNSYHQLTSDADWQAGVPEGTVSQAGSLTMGTPVGRLTYSQSTYDYSQWTSTWVNPSVSFTQLIPSWAANTPYGTWIQVFVRAHRADGTLTSFKDLGRWSTRDAEFKRTSSYSQDDGLAHVGVDTLIADPGVQFDSYQLRIRLFRLTSSPDPSKVVGTPSIASLGAVASLFPATPRSSTPLYRTDRILPVPAYSQMIHRGQYPEFGGGGEAWCSPTSLAMVLSYFGKRPSPTNYSWVNRSYADPWVDHVARLVYDYGYHGTGNWPFNTGYAAVYLPTAFVTRVGNLRDAERFIYAGIPLEASIAFGRGQLTGAPISSSPGHLLVIVGFTKAGNVVVNDPAASSDATVRRTYNRAQFEHALLAGSGGMVYVISDAAHRLPAHVGRNW
ncbi:MAG: C39 family peptidase [Actinomycetota bacterium]|nr:C39 family peptidase [Actinomycetota bacterium]